MAMIKCSGCGKEISDKAPFCVGCGNPIAKPEVLVDQKSERKFDVTPFKNALDRLKDKVVETAEVVTEQGKELVKSKRQKDDDAVEVLVRDFGNPKTSLTGSEQKCSMFKAALVSTIDLKFADVMRGKADGEKYLTYVDGQVLTTAVRNIFTSALRVTPPQIEAACNLSDAILAPTSGERERLLKTAIGVGGGSAGIAMIIAGVGSALGWGAGLVASVSAFFVGTSMAGPLGWGAAGLALAGFAAYFATSSNKHTDTERFLRVLKSSTSRAVDAIWPKYQQQLTEALNSDSAA